MRVVLSILVAACLCAAALPARAQQPEYTVGPQDVITVTVYDHADLTGNFTVESDGSFTYPLVGRLKAAGLTLREVEDSLRKALADGYLKNPQVSLSMDQYKSQRVFVMGEVRAPGTYQLTGNMTIIEALSKAGGTTQAAADEVQVVRPHAAKGSGPARTRRHGGHGPPREPP